MDLTKIEEYTQLYIDEKRSLLESFPVATIAAVSDAVYKAYLEGKTIYACGNGGNAGFVANFINDIANHPFVGEDKSKPLPSDIPRLRALDLTSSGAAHTGITNDLGFEHVFSQQLINDKIGAGDIVFGFSGSGNSGNVLKAFEVAKNVGAKSVVISRGSGGKSKDFADHCIIVPGTSNFPGQTGKNDNNFHFEDALSSVAHMITGILCAGIKERFAQG